MYWGHTKYFSLFWEEENIASRVSFCNMFFKFCPKIFIRTARQCAVGSFAQQKPSATISLFKLILNYLSVYAELVFLCAFVFEMVIRMYALGPNYFDSAFNKFDCIVIFGSIFEVFWVNLSPEPAPSVSPVLGPSAFSESLKLQSKS